MCVVTRQSAPSVTMIQLWQIKWLLNLHADEPSCCWGNCNGARYEFELYRFFDITLVESLIVFTHSALRIRSPGIQLIDDWTTNCVPRTTQPARNFLTFLHERVGREGRTYFKVLIVPEIVWNHWGKQRKSLSQSAGFGTKIQSEASRTWRSGFKFIMQKTQRRHSNCYKPENSLIKIDCEPILTKSGA